jgi:hypothetical protein
MGNPPIRIRMEPERELWLFTRGDESIRIHKNSPALILTIKGPGRRDAVYGFPACDTLDTFIGTFFTHLANDGWLPHPTADRRHTARVAPKTTCRRATRPPVSSTLFPINPT